MRNRNIPPPPKLKRSKAIDMKQEIIKSSSESSSSTSTDSSNYESDEKTEKIIIHNYANFFFSVNLYSFFGLSITLTLLLISSAILLICSIS